VFGQAARLAFYYFSGTASGLATADAATESFFRSAGTEWRKALLGSIQQFLPKQASGWLMKKIIYELNGQAESGNWLNRLLGGNGRGSARHDGLQRCPGQEHCPAYRCTRWGAAPSARHALGTRSSAIPFIAGNRISIRSKI
jgi:hypothetical protein